ncbi:hypothetical protein [Ruficoccus sp. ZRK36]|uniref:hypothetical protein n=1 Tax=Ruficoccus sp. ZRK36 TaxID=2866311 RepID=UPI001C72D45F|nr:hypothetical protein [Ruficoccus sp. ZRK36]QYY37432.1 hypothetical protein K0V07_08080 [Ruficoccus sp. ZRK36]
MAKLILEHPATGIIKNAPVGFSWTTLFFPALPALFRGDIKGFIIQVFLDCLLLGIPVVVFPFIYNKQFLMRLLREGYKVVEAKGGNLESASHKLKIKLPTLEHSASV